MFFTKQSSQEKQVYFSQTTKQMSLNLLWRWKTFNFQNNFEMLLMFLKFSKQENQVSNTFQMSELNCCAMILSQVYKQEKPSSFKFQNPKLNCCGNAGIKPLLKVNFLYLELYIKLNHQLSTTQSPPKWNKQDPRSKALHIFRPALPNVCGIT